MIIYQIGVFALLWMFFSKSGKNFFKGEKLSDWENLMM